ncbi:venom dipeptidyl peptidase 4-like isoform X2 [Daktulosphaira vitifoliae]|uniref:venom dipeptidyl peptidase 4-like isoform X2 n=1 Tax=Daktulosphaira vitifoliae TaxID=58002 RepID=UPI0021AAFBB2|nr:venom dipeptidyl peptidase 4-like isoform X2 [Daktulosphaira vitifoliae]XP_050526617.1 venom dipeptidyl peptidase 4-like isoform X2 [Daktulosphaira vitifoliae]
MPPNRLEEEFTMRSSSDVFHSPNSVEKCLWNVKNRPLTFFVLLCVVIAILGGIVFFTTDIFNKPEAQTNLQTLDFNELMKGSYEPNHFNGTWISDSEILMKDANGHIVLFNVKTMNNLILASNSTPNVDKCFQFELSANKEYLLIAYRYRKVYRHSFTANYDLINVKTGVQQTLINSVTRKPRELQLAKWSPIGSALALVEQNNIFYKSSAFNQVEEQITVTGDTNTVNGIPDWVYEEEVLSSNSALWFSKSGTKLAFASFNDVNVSIMVMPLYGQPGNLRYQYPSNVGIHYPKVGTPNPIVEFYVKFLNKKDLIKVSPPVDINENDLILNNVLWSDDSNLFINWMNRVQNETRLAHYIVSDDEIKLNIVTKLVQNQGWLDFTQTPLVGINNSLAIIHPVKQANGEFYRHVNLVQPDGTLKALTSGSFEVIELLKWNLESNIIYFTANTEENPEEEYMYKIKALENSKMECLTCTGTCEYSSIAMSEGGSYFTHTCSGPDVPEIHIMNSINGQQLLEWDLNIDLKVSLKSIVLPRVLFIDVPLLDDYKARVKLILPPTLDENSDTKYPMLVNTYAGPGSNLALKKFYLDWNKYFSVDKNIIIAQIDGRGSGRRGNKYLFANYRKLGTYEIEDQITVAKYLQTKYSYVDSLKTAIWGWSYGGFTSGMALAKDDKKIFKCALSVAPVTDWIYYDTIYTERYMGLFSENLQGYQNASLITYAENIRGKKFMLIHGTFDDNVHYQQSMMLSNVLEHKVVLFRQQTYPDEAHGLNSVRPHVYQTIGSFFNDCFGDKM